MDKQWQKVLDIIKSEVSTANYRQWFAPLKVDPSSGETLVLLAPSAFIKENILKRFQSTLNPAVESVWGQLPPIEIHVDHSVGVRPSEENEESEENTDFFDLPMSAHAVNPSNIGLNPKNTMETFVVGLSNNLAYAAAQAVIQNPGVSYNPLFIYGGTGVGKTHLMQAIGNALIKKNPGIKIIYCSSERFTNDFVESIQTKKTAEFRAKYRNCDLFLMDDVQFIAGRDSTQEEFFHTFNELQGKNTQLVLTSDRPPSEMQKLESRLSSRFQGGLMVDIQNPDFDTRVAILRAKCQEKGEIVPEECLTILAEHTETNARELEGKLIQIIQTAKLRGLPLTVEYVQNFLGTKAPQAVKIDAKKVISSINQYFNIKMTDLTGPRRNKELVLPRQITMYLLYEECNVPYEKIGGLLGGRDHTTILHGVEKIREVINRDREIQRMLIEIKQALSTN